MSKRNIVTRFYFQREIKKINRGVHPELAILNCVYHMQRNDYHARIAEICNDETGQLYAVVTRNVNGVIKIVYKDDKFLNDLQVNK